MATYPKIADNEMNYFQFKARQLLLLKKEDQEWQEFCKQVAPECTACLAENTNSKESKEIGIQANPRTPFRKLERPSAPTRKENEQIPEALNNIRARLENIDLALSKIYSVPDENEKRKKDEIASVLKSNEGLKLVEEERRRLIQSSLKTSLEKLQSHPLKAAKKQSTIKPKNCSFFLPHDLQVKRAAARKAYLASLQTKPKVSFQNVRQIAKKSAQSIQNKKVITKLCSKSRKKIIPKKVNIPSNVEKATLVASIEDDEPKDENIEYIVDAILEDLLVETGLDLNRIKQRKKEREINIIKQKTSINEEKGTNVSSRPLTASPVKNTVSKVLEFSDNQSLTKLKIFLNSSSLPHQSENERTELPNDAVMRKTSILDSEYPKQLLEETNLRKCDTDIFKPKQFSRSRDDPKFVCDVLNSIMINPEKAKDITQSKKKYWKYLENISRTVKGNFNPWILNRILAESILDDCINDISEELSDVPSAFVQDLYNREFIQQVEE